MQRIHFIKRLYNPKTPNQGSEQATGFDLYAADTKLNNGHEWAN